MRLKFFRKIKQRTNDWLNVWSVAGWANLYEMVILPHTGSRKTQAVRKARKYQAVLSFLQHEYADLIAAYRQKTDTCPVADGAPVWVCWWQGEANMPSIVRVCYQSLCRNVGTRPVVLLTEENYRQYVSIPDYILEKVRKGNISFTHFSDILRMCLLYEHGGLWVDATVYVTQPLGEEVFKKSLFTVAAGIPVDNVSEARWMGFILGGSPKGLLFGFMRELFFAYWKRHSRLLDYFLIDYAIATAYHCIPLIKEQLDEIPVNHSRIFDLVQFLNRPYNQEDFAEFCACQTFYKLSYKQKLSAYDEKGQITFYGYLLKERD